MKWNIHNKLFTTSGVTVLLLLVLVLTINKLLTDSVAANEAAKNQVAAAALSTEIKIDVIQVWQWLTDISATRAAPGYDDGFAKAETYAQQFHQNLEALAHLRPDKKQALSELSVSFAEFYAEGQEMAHQYIEGGPAQGNPAMDRFDGYATAMTNRLDALVLNLNQGAEESLQSAVDHSLQVQRISFWFMLVIAVSAAGVSWWIARGIVSSLKRMLHTVNRIAQGDFEHRVKVQGQDELAEMSVGLQQMLDYLQQIARSAHQVAQGDLTVTIVPQSDKDVLGQAFSRMLADLKGLIGQVTTTARSVGQASAQLAAVSNQAGQATHQIAGTIQQVSLGVQQQTEDISRTATSIRQVHQAVEGVAKGAQEQALAATETGRSTTDLVRSVQSIDDGTNEQAQVFSAAQAAAASLDKAIAQIVDLSLVISEFIQANLKTAQDGQQTAREAMSGMDQLGAATEDLAQTIQELGQRSGQIGTVVETIEDIAAQTNLLALNAAIEAARAGEQGKGFAVVANEVRHLAERATQATQEISQMILAVQGGANRAVAAMSQASRDVRQAVSRTQTAGAAFEAIAGGIGQAAGTVDATVEAVTEVQFTSEQMKAAIEAVSAVTDRNQSLAAEMRAIAGQMVHAVEQVTAVVEENTASTEEMAASAGEVSEAIESIAGISEENSAAVQEVSAATQEMSAQVEEVTASAQALQDMAQHLQRLVSQFKLEQTGSAPTPSPQPLAYLTPQLDRSHPEPVLIT